MAEENCELMQQDFQVYAVSGVCLTFGFQKLYLQRMANELSKQHSRFFHESIVVIISPLVALMKDQASFLQSLNICAEFVEADQVEKCP